MSLSTLYRLSSAGDMSLSLLSFPDETLLQIASHLKKPSSWEFCLDYGRCKFPPHHKRKEQNGDLYNLALTCKRLSTIARETILSDRLFVHYTKLDSALHLHLRHPQFASRVKTLEIVDCAFSDHTAAPPRWTTIDDQHKQWCVKKIRGLDINEKHKGHWIAMMGRDQTDIETHHNFATSQTAILSLLLVILPNLRRLLVGALDIASMPAFGDLLWNRDAIVNNTSPQDDVWHSGYFLETMRLIAPKLTSLDLPLLGALRIDRYQGIPRSTELSDLFTNLQTLTISPKIFEELESEEPTEPTWYFSAIAPRLKHINIVGGDWRTFARGVISPPKRLQTFLSESFGLQSATGYHIIQHTDSGSESRENARQHHDMREQLARRAKELGIHARLILYEGFRDEQEELNILAVAFFLDRSTGRYSPHAL